ncbi:RHS repeat domain-containing protein [Cellvibrio sp. PSBB006]|uniref:RHS repeat domain-containing protein n=1 Tax=Cellvibrio sp. PSBB006 TaxID=1987723 RepID=UPI0012F8059A|nr:RHS repeat-associated core domain-containing protein [Cellvibrio sp. PSBB006]
MDANGTPQRKYIYFNNQPVAFIANSTIYYIHTDHLNTPQVVTDQNQQVVWMGDYQPFGKLADTTSQTNSIELYSRFPGQYFDSEAGLYYNYFRDYDPSIGRYIQSDPIGLEGGINTYAYVNANPLIYADPEGLTPAHAARVGWSIGTNIGRGFNWAWEAAAGQTLGGSIYDALNTEVFSVQSQVDQLNQSVANDESASVPWPERNKGKWTAICKVVDQSPDACPTASGNKVGWGYGIANDMTSARRAAEKMAKDSLGSSNVHHPSCKCISPQGQAVPLCR